jgi:hypothetical protein
MMTAELYTYILVRNDLPSMTPGKAMAQVHHAGVQMATKCAEHPIFQTYIGEGQIEGADAFSTTIVLSASVADIENVIARLHNTECIYGIVVDPSYPFLVDRELTPYLLDNKKMSMIKPQATGSQDLFTRQELTCAWCLGDRSDILFKSALDGLKLL